jgi:hypothetical protein
VVGDCHGAAGRQEAADGGLVHPVRPVRSSSSSFPSPAARRQPCSATLTAQSPFDYYSRWGSASETSPARRLNERKLQKALAQDALVEQQLARTVDTKAHLDDSVEGCSPEAKGQAICSHRPTVRRPRPPPPPPTPRSV